MRLLVVAVLLAGCVSTNTKHHRHAYIVDGVAFATGAIALTAGAIQNSTCERSNDTNCRFGSNMVMSFGGVVAFLGAVGAIANVTWTEWWPFNWGAPAPAQGWQRPTLANPPIATGGNQQ
jgi:hypothetical protein